MGAHTLAACALADPERVAGVVVIGPAWHRRPARPPRSLAYWDRLADGLASGGVDGFMEAYDHDLDPAWRETVLRITRDRLGRHRHPEAVAEALREVPRSQPFEDLGELEFLDLPALVVASHDEADPGHPYAVAEAWAERLPQGAADQRGAGRVAARLAGRQAVARDRRLLRATRGRRAPRRLSGSAPGAVAEPVDEAQARPGLVDRADLVVDQPGREGELADDVLGQVGGDARGALRPRDPEPAGGIDRSARGGRGAARAARAG